jgi:predicted RNA-binding protein associated with RNAse of E/G family
MPRLAIAVHAKQPAEVLDKDELRDAAMRERKVSKNAFDFAWIDAIERAGQHDWYEPLRRRPRGKS